MQNYNAPPAKRLVSDTANDEIHSILVDIRSKAENGETVLHIYEPLKKQTKDELIKRGFRLVDQPSIAVQKDNLYYSIYWD
jgi:hypothetical protein